VAVVLVVIHLVELLLFYLMVRLVALES